MQSSQSASRKHNPFVEVLLLGAMTLVSSASGAAMYTELGLAAWVAVCLALVLHAALIGLHLIVRRLPQSDAPPSVSDLEAALSQIERRPPVAASMTASPARGRPTTPRTPAPADTAADKATLPQRLSGPPLRQTAPAPGQPRAAEQAPSDRSQAKAVQAPSADRNLKPAGQRNDTPAQQTDSPEGAPLAAGHSVGDLWAYRPSAPSLETARVPQSSRAGEAAGTVQAEAATREASIELVQGAVKQLADKVNGIDPGPRAASTNKTDVAIEASLEALRSTADTMRAVSQPQPVQAPSRPENRGTPGASALRPGLSGAAAAMSEALAAGRADVLLEPFLNLEDRRHRHYRVILRLKTRSGELLAPMTSADLNASGLSLAYDSLTLQRASQLAQRLAERGKQGFMFFDVGPASLASDRYLADVAALCQEPAAWVRQLVPTFAHPDVALFSTRDWDALRDIGKGGLCFALQGLDRADVNFAILKTWGFDFVEIAARQYLAGLPGASGMVSAADVTRAVVAAGLTLSVAGITDEATIAPVVTAGAVLGRGPALGAPRPVKSDVLQQGGQHAA